jgi:subtilase family serine protease
MKTVTRILSVTFILLVLILTSYSFARRADASYHFANFTGTSPLHVYATTGRAPAGMTPDQIKTIYHLPKTGGHGTIAIIGAYDDTTIESDLNDFSSQFNLPLCTTKNTCFAKHKMSSAINSDAGWNLETTLDVEWAHAIAPQAKILLIEATTPSGANFLKAIDYGAKQKDVVAISMSWGGAEFSEETSLDSHFKSVSGATFFASSGDNGTGASWPAASPNVIAVGGTSLSGTGESMRETAWSGSGGGVSAYEKVPSFQASYSISKNNRMRAIPDVAYDADPHSGFPIIRAGVWRTVGGTSAGAPQWAAIASLGSGANNQNFYSDKASGNNTQYFKDITSGSNGSCTYYCDARAHYDYVTGLGSPLTVKF